mgnify:CR=1 FL=1
MGQCQGIIRKTLPWLLINFDIRHPLTANESQIVILTQF